MFLRYAGQKEKTLIDNVLEEIESDSKNISNILSYINSFDLVKENILYYICGFIVRSVYKKIDCQICSYNMI